MENETLFIKYSCNGCGEIFESMEADGLGIDDDIESAIRNEVRHAELHGESCKGIGVRIR